MRPIAEAAVSVQRVLECSVPRSQPGKPAAIRVEYPVLFRPENSIEVPEYLLGIVDGLVDRAAARDGSHRVPGASVAEALFSLSAVVHESLQERFGLSSNLQVASEFFFALQVFEGDHTFASA